MSMALNGRSVRFGRWLSIPSAKKRDILIGNNCWPDVVRIRCEGPRKATERRVHLEPLFSVIQG